MPGRNGFESQRTPPQAKGGAIRSSHLYKRMTLEMRPQDPSLNGDGLRFETLEHGGDEPDTMPQAIKLIDAEGRWCIYGPTMVHGKVVQSHGYEYHEEPKPTLSVVKQGGALS